MRREGYLLAGKKFCPSFVAKLLLPGVAKRQRERIDSDNHWAVTASSEEAGGVGEWDLVLECAGLKADKFFDTWLAAQHCKCPLVA